MRNKLRLRFGVLFLIAGFVGLLASLSGQNPAHAAATPTPTIPTILPFNPLITARGIPGAPIPNRLNGGTCITVNADKAYTVVAGDTARHDYMVWLDSTSTATGFRCTWGDDQNHAPTITPTSTVGAELTAKLPFYIEVSPGARMDCISESGNGCLDTQEE